MPGVVLYRLGSVISLPNDPANCTRVVHFRPTTLGKRPVLHRADRRDLTRVNDLKGEILRYFP
jgi:hypothetical protein